MSADTLLRQALEALEGVHLGEYPGRSVPDAIDAIRAHLARPEPDRMVLVPLEPTTAMLDAASQLLAEAVADDPDDEPHAWEYYNAMVAAAPNTSKTTQAIDTSGGGRDE